MPRECSYDGTRALLYRLEMGENEQLDIAIETPRLPRGFHELTVLAFGKTEEHETSDAFRYSTDLNYLYTSRAVLLVDASPQEAPSTEYVYGTPQPYRQSPLNGVVINQQRFPKSIRAWLREQVSAGDVLEYYIHLGNDDGPAQTFAVMAFWDFRQVPVNEKHPLAFVSLPTGTGITLPASVRVPQTPGLHELMVVIIRSPYHLLEDPTTRQLTREPTEVEPSIRVAIEVQGP